MTDYFPLLLALFVIVATFLSAMNHGVVKLLASGLAALVLMVILGLGIAILPALGERMLNIELTWKANFGLACVFAILGFTISRLILGWGLRKVMGPEGFLHRLSDGVPGGVVSLVPSLIIVIFLFSCFRIGGTVLELNHVATLCQNEVTNTITKLPGYPTAAKWRNAIDRLPVVPDALDAVDPLSRRSHRNVAAFVMAERSRALRKYLHEQPETAHLMESKELAQLAANEDVVEALESQDRIAFVTLPEIRSFAAGVSDQNLLKDFEWQPFLEGFVTFIESNAPPSLKQEQEQEQEQN